MKVQNSKFKVQNYGFTLVEALVVILLVAAGSIVLATMFIGHTRIYRSTTAELDVSSGARFALDDIDSYVRQADLTLSTYSTYTAGPQVLILRIQAVNSSNRLVVGAYDEVIYYLNSGKLMRRIIADPLSSRVSGTKLLTENVSDLSFVLNNPDYAQVTEVATAITTLESAGHTTPSFVLNTKARLRNH